MKHSTPNVATLVLVAILAWSLGMSAGRPASVARAAPPAKPAARAPNRSEGLAQDEHKPVHPQPAQAGPALPADGTLADTSIYRLPARFTDQHGKDFKLAWLRGSAVLMTMFYASCSSVCPMIVAQLKRIDDALAPAQRARTQVLLVSLDPERDDVAKLKEMEQRHGIDDPRWHFVLTSAASVREVAAVLGVRYRAMPKADISHSPLIVLLDREGKIVMRWENTADDPAALIAATRRAADSAGQ